VVAAVVVTVVGYLQARLYAARRAAMLMAFDPAREMRDRLLHEQMSQAIAASDRARESRQAQWDRDHAGETKRGA